MRFSLIIVLVYFSVLCAAEVRSKAEDPESFFPASTKGFLTVTNVKAFLNNVDSTSFGEMRKNPDVKAFLDDFAEKVMARIRKKSLVSLGLQIDELIDVTEGEFSIGVVQPKPELLGIISVAEISDLPAVTKLLEKVEANLLRQEGVKLKGKPTVGDATMSHFVYPDPKGIAGSPHVFFGRTDEWMFSYYGPVFKDTDEAEHLEQVEQFLKALDGQPVESLASTKNYQEVMKRVISSDEFSEHDVRWYAESFRFIDAAKKLWPERFKDSKIGAFRKVGFDALKSVGGIAKVYGNEEREALVRAFIYAPPVDENNRFTGSARMLDFTADKYSLQDVPAWSKSSNSSYLSFHCRLLKAFDLSKDLIDEMWGEKSYQRTVDSFELQSVRYRFKLRDEFFEKLGTRVIAIRDPQFPAKVSNRRAVFAVETTEESDAAIAKNRQGVQKAIYSYFNNEDQNNIETKKVILKGEPLTIYTQIFPSDENDVPEELKGSEFDLGGGGLGDEFGDLSLDGDSESNGASSQDNQLRKISVAYYNSTILFSRDTEFLEEVLKLIATSPSKSLTDEPWFKSINEHLDQTRNPDSFESLRYAMRMDLPYKAAFELLSSKEGDLPIERLAKDLLGEDEDEDETQFFDKKKIPKDFDSAIGQYLNLIGCTITTEKEGWMFNGVIIKKPDTPTSNNEFAPLPKLD